MKVSVSITKDSMHHPVIEGSEVEFQVDKDTTLITMKRGRFHQQVTVPTEEFMIVCLAAMATFTYEPSRAQSAFRAAIERLGKEGASNET
jgi:hypothetical protein